MYVEYISGSKAWDRRPWGWPKKLCPNGHLMGVSVGWYGAKYECLDCPDKAHGVPAGPSDALKERP